MIHIEEVNNDGESKLYPVEMTISRHWIIHVHVFIFNKGINCVHELIDVVQWRASRRLLARRLRKFDYKSRMVSLWYHLLAVSSVIWNHCFSANGDRCMIVIMTLTSWRHRVFQTTSTLQTNNHNQS